MSANDTPKFVLGPPSGPDDDFEKLNRVHRMDFGADVDISLVSVVMTTGKRVVVPQVQEAQYNLVYLNAAARNKKRSDLESVRDAKVDKLTNLGVIFYSKLTNNCSESLITAIQADAEFMEGPAVAAIPAN